VCMIELASAVVDGSSSSIHRQLTVRRVELEFEVQFVYILILLYVSNCGPKVSIFVQV
jgi:hypothetical protein